MLAHRSLAYQATHHAFPSHQGLFLLSDFVKLILTHLTILNIAETQHIAPASSTVRPAVSILVGFPAATHNNGHGPDTVTLATDSHLSETSTMIVQGLRPEAGCCTISWLHHTQAEQVSQPQQRYAYLARNIIDPPPAHFVATTQQYV